MESDSNEEDISSIYSADFKHLQYIYLIGFLLSRAGNSLQLSYRYPIYASYGYSRSTIEFFYIIAHASALLIGTIFASLADRFGRRLACILCGILYIISSMSLHFRIFWILAMGNLIRGVGNSFFHTEFDAWLIQEYKDRNLNMKSLPRVLRNSNVYGTIVSIATGFLAQIVVEFFGFIAPFDTSIIFFVIMIIYILLVWTENHGNKEISPSSTFVSAFQVIRSDSRIVLHGLSTALFETALYIYFIEWTPTLQQAKNFTIADPLPFGLIFACYKTFNMIGSFIFNEAVEKIRPQIFIIIIAIPLMIGLSIPVIVPNAQFIILIGFCTVELCTGAYRPSIGLLRSEYIPNEVRSTIMNYIRIPQLILIILILSFHFSLTIIFCIAVGMIFLATICLILLKDMKPPVQKADLSKTKVSVGQPPAPLYMTEQPQINVTDINSQLKK
ncbi:unnamed protein product [Adineta steineri]|uniref:Uncharacterized protein n=1 Tax=Adineta steineri TaxID=433720 RepID=A0A814A0M0_9BILA|nr:unnamed protein product [Adineta steineri]CAF3695696.1 unnamed protein product [Adineta steineri]